MLLDHGLVVFPEVLGKTMACCGCQESLHPAESICISYTRPTQDGSEQILQFLVCTTCVLKRVESMGAS